MENAVIAINRRIIDAPHTSDEASDEANDEADHAVVTTRRPRRRMSNTLRKLNEELYLISGWSELETVNGRPPRAWGSTFLSKRLLITRVELITLLRTILDMPETWESITRLATLLEWQCFGVAFLPSPEHLLNRIHVCCARVAAGMS